jgi:hypothetical protein
MAAGLLVGHKGRVGLALGVAAVAGARWLMACHENRVQLGTPENDLSKANGVVPALPEPSLNVLDESFAATTVVVAPPPPVMIYEQQGDMPSRNGAQEGSVWYALFNEAPQGINDAPCRAAPPEGAQIPVGPPENGIALDDVFDAGPLPGSFFSESPGIVESVEGGDAGGPGAVVFPEPPPQDAAVMPSNPWAASLPAKKPMGEQAQQIEPMSPLSQIVAKPQTAAAERVPRFPFETSSPLIDAATGRRLALVLPLPERKLSVQPKKEAAEAPVHRSIVPHEMLVEYKAPRRWPLVVAASALVLVAVLVMAISAGMDGGLVKEWKLRWMGLGSAQNATEEADTGLWSRDTSKVVASPTAPK